MDDTSELLARLSDESATLESRTSAGEELGARDPRATAVDRVSVPAGDFTYRKEPREGAGPRGPGVQVFVSAFAIDRFPVTVAAFARFVDAGGYSDRRFWSA